MNRSTISGHDFDVLLGSRDTKIPSTLVPFGPVDAAMH